MDDEYWKKIKERMNEIDKKLEEHLEELRRKFPKERKEALEECEKFVSRLKDLRSDISDFSYRWFLTEERKITELGKVGRAVKTEHAINQLDILMSTLDEICESLEAD